MEADYSFMSLDAESLRLAPAWQEADRAFFDANPERTYTVRPAHPGEYGPSPTTQTCSSSYDARHAAQSIVTRS